jgi:hypothetical protein
MLGSTSIHPQSTHLQEKASNPNFTVELSSDVQQVEFSTTAHHVRKLLLLPLFWLQATAQNYHLP